MSRITHLLVAVIAESVEQSLSRRRVPKLCFPPEHGADLLLWWCGYAEICLGIVEADATGMLI